ncbi:MAG TPA: GrpB family protein [Archangium sp.]|nr:GrpB family protein [Archangium sp.]
MTPSTTLQPYEDLPASLQEPDPRNAAVAARLAGLIQAEYPEAAVHHIGSTSVPELAGKGVIDLALEYPPGGLEQARGALERLRAAYVRAKEAILQQGITDPLAYCLRKGEFIEAFLARHGGTS